MISIVIPLYNKEKQVENTLRSVFSQTFQDFEIVIVNDGSTDRSVEMVKRIADDRIRVIEQANQGVAAARNAGMQAAKYDYIALLDADDEWKPTYLATQVDLISSFSECQVFACEYERKSGKKITPIILNKMPFQGEKGVLTNYFEVASCSHPPLWASAVVVKKEAIQAVGGFPVGIKSGEDLLTWARLAVKYKIAYSKKSAAIFIEEEMYAGKLENRLDTQDVVGNALLQLYQVENAGKIKNDLRLYLIRWYKMAATIAIEVGNSVLSRNAIKKAFALGASKYDLKIQYVLSWFPGKIAMDLFNTIKKIR